MLIVRRAGPGDAPRLGLIAQATFLETFAGLLDGSAIVAHCACEHSSAAYETWLADPSARLWLAETESGRAPVGYSLLAPPSLPVAIREGDFELKRIYLLSRFHGSGVGAALIQAAIEEARMLGGRRLLLGVYAHNERAKSFYTRTGFKALGERRFSVGDQTYEDNMFELSLGSR